MKKFLLLIAAVAMLGSATAQTNKQTKKLTFGPKIGFNLSDMKFDAVGKENVSGFKPGLLIGAFVEYRTCKWFAVSADVLYSQQGLNTTITRVIGDYKNELTTDYKMQYLNIPIMANFYIVKGLALKAGFQPGFLLSSKLKMDVNGEKSTTNVKKSFKSTDFSIPVGISYTFKMGLVIDARYNISVTDIATSSLKDMAKEEGTTLDKVKNNVISLSVGWKF